MTIICHIMCKPHCVCQVILLPTAYVVRREGYVLTRVCPSIHPSVCLSTGGGRYPGQVQPGVGVPAARSERGGGGVTEVGYLQPGLTGGVPLPHQRVSPVQDNRLST